MSSFVVEDFCDSLMSFEAIAADLLFFFALMSFEMLLLLGFDDLKLPELDGGRSALLFGVVLDFSWQTW